MMNSKLYSNCYTAVPRFAGRRLFCLLPVLLAMTSALSGCMYTRRASRDIVDGLQKKKRDGDRGQPAWAIREVVRAYFDREGTLVLKVVVRRGAARSKPVGAGGALIVRCFKPAALRAGRSGRLTLALRPFERKLWCRPRGSAGPGLYRELNLKHGELLVSASGIVISLPSDQGGGIVSHPAPARAGRIHAVHQERDLLTFEGEHGYFMLTRGFGGGWSVGAVHPGRFRPGPGDKRIRFRRLPSPGLLLQVNERALWIHDGRLQQDRTRPLALALRNQKKLEPEPRRYLLKSFCVTLYLPFIFLYDIVTFPNQCLAPCFR